MQEDSRQARRVRSVTFEPLVRVQSTRDYDRVRRPRIVVHFPFAWIPPMASLSPCESCARVVEPRCPTVPGLEGVSLPHPNAFGSIPVSAVCSSWTGFSRLSFFFLPLSFFAPAKLLVI